MSEASNFHEIKIEKDFNRICLHNFDKMIVVLFFADWHDASKHLITIFESLSKMYEKKCVFAYVNADNVETLTTKFDVNVVPTIILTTSTKETLCRIETDTPAAITEKIDEHSEIFQINFENQKSKMFNKIEATLKTFPLMTFIKGTPQEPKCGFTEQLLEVLKNLKVKFGYFDILSDENMRNWLRYYAKWITYPQVYVEGKLVGGLDVTKDLVKSGKFQEMIKHLNLNDDPDVKIDKILGSGPVVAFMKGTPSAPADEDSKQFVKILADVGVRYNCFDATTADEKLLNTIKEKLGDTKYPFLVVDKKVLGDLKTLEELIAKKELTTKIPASEITVTIKDKIHKLLNQAPVMVFMKGTAEAPNCGFSKRLVDILDRYNVSFSTFNILADQEVREELKEISGWKTYPQMYVEGKLIGGIDIVEELDESNEFEDVIAKYHN
jgi:Grx4 family monothiol glutaredoxin